MAKNSKSKMVTRVMAAAIAAAAMFSGIASTQAAVLINIDFGGQNLKTGAAVLGVSGDTWNNGAGSNLVNSANVGTTVDVTLSALVGFYGTSGGGAPTSDGLMFDYANRNNDSFTVTLSDLAINTTYDIVAYGAGDSGTQGSLFAGALTGTTTGAQRTSYVSGVNYVRGLATSNGSGVLTFTVSSNGSTYSVLNGLQIQDAPAIPEPASLGLLGMGALALLARRRK